MITKSKLQSLKSLLKAEISSVEEQLGFLKNEIQNLYIASDPSEKNGEFYFKVLNASRDEQRSEKKRLKRLVEIQKAIKKEIQGGH
jgi:hypothetical protein